MAGRYMSLLCKMKEIDARFFISRRAKIAAFKVEGRSSSASTLEAVWKRQKKRFQWLRFGLDTRDQPTVDADYGSSNIGGTLARKKCDHVAVFARIAIAA